MAKSNYSKVDEYGFERPENFNYEQHDRFMSAYMRVLIRRAQRWNTLKTDHRFIKNNTLRRFVRKGIPSNLRPTVWMSISGANKLKQQSKFTYAQMKQIPTTNRAINESIQIDLPRTFPDNIFFTNDAHLPGQLFNVLSTFAHQNLEVGYCQGLNYIAGLLLLATKDEEISFWLLKALIEQILPQYYIKTMSGLLVDLDVLDDMILKYEPSVHRHVHNISMPWAMGTSKWFICLYAEVLPTETVLRIWDCLFYEGSSIIFRAALTLIRLHKVDILKADELGELMNCFKNMQNHERVIDCHQFMSDIFKMPNKALIKQLGNLREKHTK